LYIIRKKGKAMKKMNKFHAWLSSKEGSLSPFNALTRLKKAQLTAAANGFAWWVWDAA